MGPADALLLSCSRRSSVKTLSRRSRGFRGTGRLVAAPGLDNAPETLADLAIFCLGGAIATGPPNFLLIATQRSGRRDEKLTVLVNFIYTR